MTGGAHPAIKTIVNANAIFRRCILTPLHKNQYCHENRRALCADRSCNYIPRGTRTLKGVLGKPEVHRSLRRAMDKHNAMSRAPRSAQYDRLCSMNWPSNPPGSGLQPQLRCFQTLLNGYRHSGRRSAALMIESGLGASGRRFGRCVQWLVSPRPSRSRPARNECRSWPAVQARSHAASCPQISDLRIRAEITSISVTVTMMMIITAQVSAY